MQLVDESSLMGEGIYDAWPKNWDFSNGIAAEILACQPYQDKKVKNPIIWSFAEVLGSHPAWFSYADCFDKEIHCTDNYLITRQGIHDLFNRYSKVSHQMLLVKDKDSKNYRIILLSLHDASSFEYEMAARGQQTPDHVWLLDSEGKVIAGPTETLEAGNAQLERVLIQGQFLAGSWESLSTPQWKPALEQWFSKGKRDKRNLFEIAILNKFNKTGYRDCEFEKVLNENMGNEQEGDEGENLLKAASLAAQLGKLMQAKSFLDRMPKEAYTSNHAFFDMAMQVMRPFLITKNEALSSFGIEILGRLIAACEKAGWLENDECVFKFAKLLEGPLPDAILAQIMQFFAKACQKKPNLAIPIAHQVLTKDIERICKGDDSYAVISKKCEILFELMLIVGNSETCSKLAAMYKSTKEKVNWHDMKSYLVKILSNLKGVEENEALKKIQEELTSKI